MGTVAGGLRALSEEWLPSAPTLVCDPFCGAGSSLVAARSLGHRVIGADMDPANVALTRTALAKVALPESGSI